MTLSARENDCCNTLSIIGISIATVSDFLLMRPTRTGTLLVCSCDETRPHNTGREENQHVLQQYSHARPRRLVVGIVDVRVGEHKNRPDEAADQERNAKEHIDSEGASEQQLVGGPNPISKGDKDTNLALPATALLLRYMESLDSISQSSVFSLSNREAWISWRVVLADPG
jgi:hypothetical protein